MYMHNPTKTNLAALKAQQSRSLLKRQRQEDIVVIDLTIDDEHDNVSHISKKQRTLTGSGVAVVVALQPKEVRNDQCAYHSDGTFGCLPKEIVLKISLVYWDLRHEEMKSRPRIQVNLFSRCGFYKPGSPLADSSRCFAGEMFACPCKKSGFTIRTLCLSPRIAKRLKINQDTTDEEFYSHPGSLVSSWWSVEGWRKHYSENYFLMIQQAWSTYNNLK